MEFKDRLKALRNDMGLSALELSKMLGKSESAIRMWESGKNKPDADTLIEMATELECSTDYLLGLDANKNKAVLDTKNRALIELEDLVSRTELSPDIMGWLVWVFLAPHYSPEEMGVDDNSIDKDASLILSSLVARMASIASSSVSLLSKKSVDILAYSKYIRDLSENSVFAEALLKLYIANLVKKTTTHLLDTSQDGNEMLVIANMASVYSAGADLKKSTESLGRLLKAKSSEPYEAQTERINKSGDPNA